MWLTLLFLPAGIGVTYAFSQPENRHKIERFVEDDLQVPPTLNVLPALTPTTAEAPETADAASGTTEADEPVAHPKTAEPDAAQPTTAEEGAQPAQSEATAPTNPSSAPDQKSAPTNRPDSAQTGRTGTTFFTKDGEERPYIGRRKHLTSQEYEKARKKYPFITIYIDNSEKVRLQDIDGSIRPTSFSTFVEDTRELLKRAFSERYLDHKIPHAPGLRMWHRPTSRTSSSARLNMD